MIRPFGFAAAIVLCLASGEIAAQAEWQVVAAEDGQFEAMFPEAPRSYTDQ